MAAFLVAALAVPHAFDDDALIFALAYATARWWLHIFLFAEANDDVTPRCWRVGLAHGDPGPGLLIVAAFPRRARLLPFDEALTIDFKVRSCSACAASGSRRDISPSASA